MNYFLVALVRTLRLNTTSVGHVVFLHECGPQIARTLGGKLPGLGILGSPGQHWPHDFGNHVAGLAHHHGVTWAHIFELHLFSVVQRGHRHGAPGHHHGLKFGERCGATGSAN